jgi:hypothetical protein
MIWVRVVRCDVSVRQLPDGSLTSIGLANFLIDRWECWRSARRALWHSFLRTSTG